MEIKRKCNTLRLTMVTPVQQNSFLRLRKALKKQVSQTGKRVISVLYDNKTQMRNEDRDYGDLPRSKKQLIDLPRSSLMDSEVLDILAYNEELNNDATLWHILIFQTTFG